MKNLHQIAVELVRDIFTWMPERYRTDEARKWSERWVKSAIEKATNKIAIECAELVGEANMRVERIRAAQAWNGLRAQLKKEGLPQDHINQIIDGMNRDIAERHGGFRRKADVKKSREPEEDWPNQP